MGIGDWGLGNSDGVIANEVKQSRDLRWQMEDCRVEIGKSETWSVKGKEVTSKEVIARLMHSAEAIPACGL